MEQLTIDSAIETEEAPSPTQPAQQPAAEQPKQEEATPEQELEAIVPNKEHVKWSFGGKTYTQKPLSFFGKMEFFSIVGSAVDLALQEGVTMNQLMAGATSVSAWGRGGDGMQDADSMMKLLARLMVFSPTLLADMYVVFLGVPRGEREAVKSVMIGSEDEGGLNDEDAVRILHTFIDQNAEALQRFFVQEAPRLFKRGRTLMKQSSGGQSRQSKR